MYNISNDIISESRSLTQQTTSAIIRKNNWKIEILGTDGGLIKNFDLYSKKIKSFSFSEGEKGSLDASFKFNKIDFPVYINSVVSVFYNDEKIYRGYITNIPSYTEADQLKCAPFTKKLENIYINKTYTAQTFKQILSDILTTYTTYLNIYYNNDLLTDYTNENTYTVTYDFETAKKIIEDYVELVDDVYYGVAPSGYFYVKKRSSEYNHILHSGQNQHFSNFSYKKDWAKIKNTRFHVFQKTTDSKTRYIDTIPDGSTVYPYIDAEKTIGIIEGKLTAPAGFSDDESKDYAYAKLIAQTAPENVKIKDIDIRRHDIKIGEKVKLFDNLDWQLKSLLTCETRTGWHPLLKVTLSSLHKIEGDYSITFGSSIVAKYEFETMQRFEAIKNISFMIMSDTPGLIVSVGIYGEEQKYGYASTSVTEIGQGKYSAGNYSIGNYSVGNIASLTTSYGASSYTSLKSMYLPSAGSFHLLELPASTYFFGWDIFTTSSTGGARIYIDDIRINATQKATYEGTVISRDFDIGKDNIHYYDIEVGDFNPLINDKLFEMEQKIKQLEANQQQV